MLSNQHQLPQFWVLGSAWELILPTHVKIQITHYAAF